MSGSSKSSSGPSESSGSMPSSGSGSSCVKPSVVNVIWERTAGLFSGGATLNAFGNYAASSGDFINIDWNAALNRWQMWDGGGFTIAIKNGAPCDPAGTYMPVDADVLAATVTT